MKRLLRKGWGVIVLAGMAMLSAGLLTVRAEEIELQQGAANALVERYQGTQITMIIDREWEGLTYFQEKVLHLMGAEASSRRRILIRFDLDLLKGKVEAVESASLTLYKHHASVFESGTDSFSVYEVSPENAGWTEASWLSPKPGDHWAGAPGLRLPGADFREPPIAEQVPYLSANPDGSEIAEIAIPKELVQEWITGSNAGLLLIMDEEESSDRTLFIYSAAAENDPAVCPKLRITYRTTTAQ